ncbi:hypothetical protein B0J18DRAFT_447600 [Chaetomium sp. MPI-SDFR-AT-0129]|nr:hypothetical protein B0J18DRAFT_447600 [Chaetomium sp. MPI-SDFR-AT-0129]
MFGSGHGSGHTRHNGHSHGNHHHASKSSKSKSQRAALVSGVNLYSFLFVINEFVVNYEPLEGQDRPLRDPWLNIIPPQDAAAYTDELVGTVFRYQNGHVSPAQGYFCVNAVPSTGLSGDLPIILALMGFHGELGRASDVFHHQKWSMGRWNGSGRASSYRILTSVVPRSGESPRGLFVQVCADNLVEGLQDCEENNLPEAVWDQMLRELECCTILVQG